MRKRSVTIDGHRTSISLEDAFWNELLVMSRKRRVSLNVLVAEIDHGRAADGVNLSSALRLHVLRESLKQRDGASSGSVLSSSSQLSVLAPRLDTTPLPSSTRS